jgi:hypothetical protein
MAGISSHEDLVRFLNKSPPEKQDRWAITIAARLALRSLPYVFSPVPDPRQLRSDLVLLAMRAVFVCWAVDNFPVHKMAHEAVIVADRLRKNAIGFDHPRYNSVVDAAIAASDAAASRFKNSDTRISAADCAIFLEGIIGRRTIWTSVELDCLFLDEHKNVDDASRDLTSKPLWLNENPTEWDAVWIEGARYLLSLDHTYRVWIDWYDRRIEGHDAAFDIPGDTDRVEDKAILVRLADATEEDFWDKGATYVNTTLQRWIDEARARVAPMPEQDPAAITYGVNDRGQLDRLPAHDQKHLRDIPDQQFLYGRIREAAFDLLGEGQRLGVPLSRALSRFAVAIPEDFSAALALPLWAEGIILRRLYRAHRIAAESKELSSDQLEPVVAEGLGGLLDLYNHFAFVDDGLRAKDETTIPPQERASAASEAAAAAPIAAALLKTLEVATDIVIDDITSEVDARPDGGLYDDQARDHTNRNWRNRVAAIITGLRKAVVGVGKQTGGAAYGAIVGIMITETTLGKFVATNAQAFITYANTAFPTYKLAPLIEMIARMFS